MPYFVNCIKTDVMSYNLIDCLCITELKFDITRKMSMHHRTKVRHRL